MLPNMLSLLYLTQAGRLPCFVIVPTSRGYYDKSRRAGGLPCFVIVPTSLMKSDHGLDVNNCIEHAPNILCTTRFINANRIELDGPTLQSLSLNSYRQITRWLTLK